MEQSLVFHSTRFSFIVRHNIFVVTWSTHNFFFSSHLLFLSFRHIMMTWIVTVHTHIFALLQKTKARLKYRREREYKLVAQIFIFLPVEIHKLMDFYNLKIFYSILLNFMMFVYSRHEMETTSLCLSTVFLWFLVAFYHSHTLNPLCNRIIPKKFWIFFSTLWDINEIYFKSSISILRHWKWKFIQAIARIQKKFFMVKV